MILRLILASGLALQLAAAEDKGVRWASIDPFCGQLKSAEADAFPIKTARIKLYRANAKHLPCCESSKALEDVRLDRDGHFDLRKLAPGQYWLVATWGETEVPVALWFDGKHDFACDERYMNVIEIKPSTKTAEVSVIASTNSTAHAQTN